MLGVAEDYRIALTLGTTRAGATCEIRNGAMSSNGRTLPAPPHLMASLGYAICHARTNREESIQVIERLLEKPVNHEIVIFAKKTLGTWQVIYKNFPAAKAYFDDAEGKNFREGMWGREFSSVGNTKELESVFIT